MEINLAEARKMMFRAIEEKGADYIYPREEPDGFGSCFNFKIVDGQRVPDCIVGHAYSYWGILDKIMENDDRSAVTDVLPFTTLGHEDEWLLVTDMALSYLQNVQIEQDSGKPWGEAERLAWEYVQDRKADYDEMEAYR